MSSKYGFTPDLCFAIACDRVYGTAIARRHWDSPLEREEALEAEFRKLLGHPTDEEYRRITAEYAEAIFKNRWLQATFEADGFAIVRFGPPEGDDRQPEQRELPL